MQHHSYLTSCKILTPYDELDGIFTQNWKVDNKKLNSLCLPCRKLVMLLPDEKLTKYGASVCDFVCGFLHGKLSGINVMIFSAIIIVEKDDFVCITLIEVFTFIHCHKNTTAVWQTRSTIDLFGESLLKCECLNTQISLVFI